MIITLTQATKEHDTNALHQAFIDATLVPSHVESDELESRFTFADDADEGDIQDVIDAYTFSEPVEVLSPFTPAIMAVMIGYKEYTAALSQDVGAPTANVVKNTLGGEVVFSRSGVGIYRVTLEGAFLNENKIYGLRLPVIIELNGVLLEMYELSWDDEADPAGSALILKTFTLNTSTGTATLADDILLNTWVHFRVYDEQ
jgi:hypothetical protein